MDNDEKIMLDGGRTAPAMIPYMPAGVHLISATVNGNPGRRRVVVTEAACARLQSDLEQMQSEVKAHRRARPAVYFDHKTGAAAAYPKRFVWGGEEKGIMLELEEWSHAGRAAVEGRDYGYVSPAFRMDRATGEVTGLLGGVEVCSLVNDPAFERIDPIMDAVAAARAYDYPVGGEGEDEVNGSMPTAATAVQGEQGEEKHILPPRGEVENGGESPQNGCTATGGGNTNRNTKMDDNKEVNKKLGLPEDADDAARLAALDKKAEEAKKQKEEVEALRAELNKKEEELKAMRADNAQKRVDALIERGIIGAKEEERITAAKNMAMNDPAGFDAVFASMSAAPGKGTDMILGGKAQGGSGKPASNADALQAEMTPFI